MTSRRRVLFACVPQAGHVTPLLPLAAALAARGDEIVVASGPSVADAVTASGLVFRPVCPNLDEWFGRLAARTRGSPGDGLAPSRIEHYFVPRLFAEIGLDQMVDGLDALANELRPDLLVFEPYAFAAPLVAARYGVAQVHHGIGLPAAPAVVALVNDAVTPAWRAAGLTPPRGAGRTIVVTPPSLAPRRIPRSALLLRPAPLPEPTAALPISVPYPDRPLVYVTLGTFSNTNVALFRLVLAALADLPVSVLVTAGHGFDPDALGAVPDNALVTDFVPQAALLPHCAAVVHHAGAGTMFGVLAHGLPAVALPQSADNFLLADRLAASGAAVRLLPGAVTVRSVGEATRTVLSDPATRQAAMRLASEIAAMPDAPAIAERL